ncbi:MAG: FecR domain-containing protein [Lachnospiraceae bacterium]|nr:FecR domain-containing protein [Lachnospiraceae bacterium]
MLIRRSDRNSIVMRGVSLFLTFILLQTAVCGNCITAHAAEAEASTIRLVRTEGRTEVKQDGKVLTQTEGMRLFSGSCVSTAESSYAWLMLDDTKAAKLDAYSEAVIEKNGGALEITLNAGRIFFDVTEKLSADESFTIRTSTMAMGIRGTIGVVEATDFNKAVLYILEGEVVATVTNPETGEKRSGQIRAGEIADTDALVELPAGTTETITIRRLERRDITGFVLAEIAGGNIADAGKTRFQAHGGEDVLSRRIYDATQENLDLRGVQPGEAEQQLEQEQAPIDPWFLDYHYYGVHNPDVVDELGTDPAALKKHWDEFGKKEGRDPNTGIAMGRDQEKYKKEAEWEDFYAEQLRLIAEEEARKRADGSVEESGASDSSAAEFTINCAQTASDGSTMSVSPAKAKKGDTVTVSIDSTGSYWVYVTYNGKTVQLTTSGSSPTQVTFTMPGNSVSITASPIP